MNHPRYSVLSLFDPLNAPSTPRREVITPDSGSDKENAEPTGARNSENAQSYLDDDKLTMSAFFNRVHAQSKQYAPAAFRKRLVDIGDVTVSVDEASELMGDLTITRGPEESTEEEDLSSDDELHLEDLTDSHISASRRQPPSSTDVPRTPQQASNSQRTPLAELSPDATPVPLKTLPGVSDATVAIAIDYHKSPATAVRTNHLTFAPPGSPLASVINAINLTARRSDDSVVPRVEEPMTRDLAAHNGAPTPSITVSPSVDDPLISSTAHLLPSPSAALLTNAHLFESTSFPSPPSTRFEVPEAQNSPAALAPNSSPSRLSPRARPRSHTTTSSLDPRRTSVDLHSSFNWQLQCPEASFDLLNDRISFFGQDSFLGETDDFDMQAEEEMMEALAKRVREKEASEEKVRPKRRESTDGNGLRASIRCSPRESRMEKAPEVEAGSTTAPASPAVVQNTPASAAKAVNRRSSISSALPRSPTLQHSFSPKQAAASLPLSTGECHKPTEGLSIAQPLSPKEALPPQIDPSFAAPTAPDSVPTFSAPGASDSVPNSLAPSAQTPPKVNKPLVAPAPIHALRIVKRPRLHDRGGSTSSAASSANSCEEQALASAPATVSSFPAPSSAAPVAPAQPRHRPILKGLQRPPPGLIQPSAKQPNVAEPSSGTGVRASLRSKLTGISGTRAAAKEPCRVVEDEVPASATEKSSGGFRSKLQRPAAGYAGSAGASSLGRASAGKVAAAVVTESAATTKTTGLRPPSRYAAAGAASSLPRAVGTASSMSRLPAPTFGGSRMKLPGVASTVGRSAGLRKA